MAKDLLGISIPEELVKYSKKPHFYDNNNSEALINYCRNENGNIISYNSCGEIKEISYYSFLNCLIKKVFYDGGNIKRIEYYQNNKKYEEEFFDAELVTCKKKYSKDGNVTNTYNINYNRSGNVTKITRMSKDRVIVANYGYDELNRVNRRIFTCENVTLLEQNYRYDIVDRLVEYRDGQQKFIIKEIDSKNHLISYVIIDKMGDEILVTNIFDEDKYIESSVCVNGHCAKVRNKKYVDNIMLKKPYTTTDDLDLIISNIMRECSIPTTSRVRYQDALDKTSQNIIDNNIEIKTLPISIRKRIMYNIAVNSVM